VATTAQTAPPTPQVLPTSTLDPLVELIAARSEYRTRKHTEEHIEQAHEQAIREREAAEMHYQRAFKSAARLLTPSALKKLMEETDLPLELEAPEPRPRLVPPPEPPRPERTVERWDGQRALEKVSIPLDADEDERLPLWLRKSSHGRPATTSRYAYCVLRRHPEGTSIVMLHHILTRELGIDKAPNIRTLDAAVRKLRTKGVVAYKNGTPSKAEERLHGRAGAGGLRVRQFYCVR
jgi:hypothetical protein